MILLLASPLTLFQPLIWAVLFIIIAGLLFWAVQKLSVAFGIPEPVKSVLIVILVIICVVALVYYLLQSYGGLS